MQKAIARILNWIMLHTPVVPSHHVTRDLGEAAYLKLRGCTLLGVQEGKGLTGKQYHIFTFTGRRVRFYIHEYNSCRPVTFSPKLFLEARRQLKYSSPF